MTQTLRQESQTVFSVSWWPLAALLGGVTILIVAIIMSACSSSAQHPAVVWASPHLPSDVESVAISPLLQYASRGVYTVQATTTETNRVMMTSLWLDMHQGKKQSAYLGTAHWYAGKVAKLTFKLRSGEAIGFRVTLNSEHAVAGYRMLRDAEPHWDSASQEVASGHDTSRELYYMLNQLVDADSNVWVESHVDASDWVCPRIDT